MSLYFRMLIIFLLLSKISFSQQVLNFNIPECPWVSSDFKSENSEEISIYPNPAQNVVYVKADILFNCSSCKIEVYNTMGQRVFFLNTPQQKSNTYLLDVSDLGKAVYLINITNGKKRYSKYFATY